MARSFFDQNRVPTLLGALNTDGKTPVDVLAIPTSNRLKISDGTTGSDFGMTNAGRDVNRIPILMAVSILDLVTPVEVYADSNGNLLVQST